MPRRHSNKPTKPKRPQDCPLFPDNNGQWAKRIKVDPIGPGKLFCFDKWADLPGALERYYAKLAELHSETPEPGEKLTLGRGINL
jgi:hypothetical protein